MVLTAIPRSNLNAESRPRFVGNEIKILSHSFRVFKLKDFIIELLINSLYKPTLCIYIYGKKAVNTPYIGT